MRYKINDKIVFLIKFGRKEHMEQLYYKGELFFSPAAFFMQESSYGGVFDKWDSHQNSFVKNIVCAELLRDDAEGLEYGPIIKIADTGVVHEINSITKGIPVFCVRAVYADEIDEYGRFHFSTEQLTKIKKAFEGYDTFVMALADTFIHLIEQNQEGIEVLFREIEYGMGFSKEELPHSLRMFNKLDSFAEQQEFRFVLPKEQFTEGRIIHTQPFAKFAYMGNMDSLALGLMIGESPEEIAVNMEKLNNDRRNKHANT